MGKFAIIAAVALAVFLIYRSSNTPKPEPELPPDVKAMIDKVQAEMNSPAEQEKRRLAVARCNRIFNVEGNVTNGPEFLAACHKSRARKDCLQSSMDWTECTVEMWVPDPAVK